MRRAWTVGIGVALLATGLSLPGASAAGSDRPDSLGGAAAAAASPANRWIQESLTPGGDEDWFRFSMAQPAWALVTLGHLPADYSLALYDAQHRLVGKSNHSGRRFEQLYRSLGAGNYFVRVSSPSGASSSTPYALNFRPLPAQMVIAEKRNVGDIPGFDIKGELLNNTSSWRQVRRIHVTWFDRSGNTIGSCDEGVIPGAVAPRQRIEFDIVDGQPNCGKQPSGAAAYSLRIDSAVTSIRRPAGLVMTPTTHVTSTTQRVYRGTLRNTSSQTMKDIYPTVIEYDSYGRAIAFGYDHIPSLAPGASHSYTMAVDIAHLPKPNGFREYASFVQH